MKSTPKLYFLTILILLWVIFVFGGYYLYHKPFTAQQLLVWLKSGIQTLVGLIIVSCAGGIGLAILYRFDSRAALSPVIFQAAGLGLGILGTVYLVLSWIVGIRWYFSLLLIGFILIGYKRWVLRWWSSFFLEIREIVPKSRFSKGIAILIGFSLFASWLTAVAPPLAFDSLVYHLSLPIAYIYEGKFTYIPDNTFWGMPQLGEMLYTIATSIAGVEAGAILGCVIGLISLVGLVEVLKESLSPEDIWVAMSAIFCGFTFADSLGWAYVDWITFLYGWCALKSLSDWMKRSQLGDLILVGLFCGFALGTKYSAGILTLSALVSPLFLLQNSSNGFPFRKPKNLLHLQHLLVFMLVWFITSLPWWLKNLVAVGQPFYPLLFPAGEMTALRIKFYLGVETFGTWWTSLLLPVTATMLGIEGKEGFNASVGPLILLFSPFAIIFLYGKQSAEKRMVMLALIFAITGWVVWGIGSRLAGYLIQSRLYWAIFPGLVILCGFGYRKLSTVPFEGIRLRFVLNSMVFFVLSLTTLEIFSSMLQRRVFDYMMGQIDSRFYLTHNLGWHFDALRYVHELGQKTLLLFEPRSFYCLPNCDGDEILDEWYQMSLDSSLEPERILQKWKARGYPYVLIFHQGAEFVRQNDLRYDGSQWKLFEQLIPLLSVQQTFGNAYTLYRLP